MVSGPDLSGVTELLAQVPGLHISDELPEGAAVATQVRPYQRNERGRRESVRGYGRVTTGWIPEPKFLLGQRLWEARGRAARALDWAQDLHGADAFNRRRLEHAASVITSPAATKPGERIAGHIQSLRAALTGDDAYLLEFDPADQHAVIAYGDPTTARHVITYVPGAGTNLGRASPDAERSRAMRAEAERQSGEQAAVVYWVGYHAPRSPLSAIPKHEAIRAGAELARFQHKLRDAHRGGAHYTVLGHSYGSVVAGEAAARHGMRPDDLVFIGSPGVGVRHVSKLGVPSGHVWAGLNPTDPVERAAGALSPDFGGDPASAKFGAHVFNAVGGPHQFASAWERFESPHNTYWDPGSPSLRNLGAIASGHHQDVDASPGAKVVLAALVALAAAQEQVRSYDRVVRGRVQHVRAHQQRVAAHGEPMAIPGLPEVLRQWIPQAKWREGEQEWVTRGEQAWNQHHERWEFRNNDLTQQREPRKGRMAVAYDGRTRVIGEIAAIVGPGPGNHRGHDHAVIDAEDTGVRYLVRASDGIVENEESLDEVEGFNPIRWAREQLQRADLPAKDEQSLPVHPNAALKLHDPAKVRRMLMHDEASGEAYEKKPGEGVHVEQGYGAYNYFGNSDDTQIVTFRDGAQWIRKRVSDTDELGREVLTSRVSDIIGAGVPEVIREGYTLWEPKLEAVSAIEWVGGVDENEFPLGTNKPSAMYHTPEGIRIGLLDKLIGNTDRHFGNWMIARDENGREYPVPVDHGNVFWVADTDSPFARAVHLKELADIPDSTWAQWQQELEKLEPEFEEADMLSGYNTMINNLRYMRAQAAQERGDADQSPENLIRPTKPLVPFPWHFVNGRGQPVAAAKGIKAWRIDSFGNRVVGTVMEVVRPGTLGMLGGHDHDHVVIESGDAGMVYIARVNPRDAAGPNASGTVELWAPLSALPPTVNIAKWVAWALQPEGAAAA